MVWHRTPRLTKYTGFADVNHRDVDLDKMRYFHFWNLIFFELFSIPSMFAAVPTSDISSLSLGYAFYL